MSKRTLFILGLLIELVLLLGLLVPQEMILKSGTDVTLRTIPVDPRSILRGDYVTLSYEVGLDYKTLQDEYYGEVYAVLVGSGEEWKRTRVERERPALLEGEVCLRGYPSGFDFGPEQITFPDISQYFVEEGMGLEFEQATREHRLLVDISVDGFCNARIKGVRLGPEVPLGSEVMAPPFVPPDIRPAPVR